MFSEVVEGFVALDDSALTAEIRDLELRSRALDAQMAAAIAVAEQRQLHQVDGHRSMKGFLRANLYWSSHEATHYRAIARAVDRIPGVGDALLDGHIGTPQVRVLAAACSKPVLRDRLDEFAPTLLGHAERLPFDDFEIIMERFSVLGDPDGKLADTKSSVDGRNATLLDANGELFGRIVGGDPVTTAEIVKIFGHFVDQQYAADQAAVAAVDDAPLPREVWQRRYDAFIHIVRLAAKHEHAAGRLPDPLVNIVIDDTTFDSALALSGLIPTDGREPCDLLAALMDAPGDLAARRCETTTGTQLHPLDVIRAAIDGRVRRVVIDSASVTIDFGRISRLFTGRARDAATIMLRHCEHPGCDLPADWCEVDHNAEWVTDGGRTDQSNARGPCGVHNRWKHTNGWRSRRATNGHTYSFRKDGTIILPVGARPPDFPEPPPPLDQEDESDDLIEIERLVTCARTRLAALH